jgi:hypothetical protein
MYYCLASLQKVHAYILGESVGNCSDQSIAGRGATQHKRAHSHPCTSSLFVVHRLSPMGVASESSGAASFCWRRSSSWRETETKDGWSLSFGTRKSLVVFESGLVYVKAADRIGQSFIF